MSDTQKYAISQYPDVEKIYRRLDALVSQPMRPVRREKIQEYLKYFEIKCARSKALTDEAKNIFRGVFSTISPLTTRSQSPSKRPKGLISGTRTKINTLISCRLAHLLCWAITTPLCVKRSWSC